MLKVIVPLAITNKGHQHFPIHFIRVSYLKKLKRYHLMPIFVHTLMSQKMIQDACNQSGGLFLTGGADVNPALYQKKPHARTKANEKTRDQLESLLVKRAVRQKKPILAICRGLQLVNVALGGTLIQHLPETIPNEKHDSNSYQDLKHNQTHSVNIKPTSQLYRLVKKKSIQVKSHHHQAVDQLGHGLKVSATSPAKVIEAVESLDRTHFLVGVQSHPETQNRGDLEPIFAGFAQAVKVYHVSDA